MQVYRTKLPTRNTHKQQRVCYESAYALQYRDIYNRPILVKFESEIPLLELEPKWLEACIVAYMPAYMHVCGHICIYAGIYAYMYVYIYI